MKRKVQTASSQSRALVANFGPNLKDSNLQKIRKVQMKKISDLWKAVWLALRVACLFQPDAKQPANNMARSPNVIVNTISC